MKIKVHNLAIFLFFILASSNSYADNSLIVGIGGGYYDNLYADSFNVGNSYLANNIAFSSVHFNKIKAQLFYKLSYYEYNTNNNISHLIHAPGIAIYRKPRGAKIKWGISAAGRIRDYTEESSTYDNSRFLLVSDISYYLKPGLQFKGKYRGIISSYSNYDILKNIEQNIELETIKTFKSKTSFRAKLTYSARNFSDGGSNYDWFNIESKISQSINIRTGVAVMVLRRWSAQGTRPLSSFFIISGITSSWDPWNGNLAEVSMKRILPSAVLAKLNIRFWARDFTYDQQMREALPWIDGKTGRSDNGWSASASLRRQFNLNHSYGRYFSLFFMGGYYSNNSNDPFYAYDNYYFDGKLSFTLF